MASLAKSIAVFGGAGFLGRKICEVGVSLGYTVASFLRSGTPPSSEPWTRQVEWLKADIFNTASYESKLANYSTVVHSIGILFENQAYKLSINSKFDLSKLTSTVSGSNPMEKTPNSTYAAIQRDSALALADSFINQQPGPKNYVYISADQAIPIIPKQYIITKREAEFELGLKHDLRTIVIRPGFMYEDTPNFTNRDLLKNLLNLGYSSKELILGDKVDFVNKLIRPPVSTEKVAYSLFEKLQDNSFKGVVGLDEIVK